MMGPPEKNLDRQYTTTDTSRLNDPATHSRGQTTSNVCEWQPYDLTTVPVKG